jgi:hypothetical protein
MRGRGGRVMVCRYMRGGGGTVGGIEGRVTSREGPAVLKLEGIGPYQYWYQYQNLKEGNVEALTPYQ